ncbi:C40 family peptidase [Heliobacterium chlorum]|uniref:C40 family peptidase n=1 Tax=Heliobacterium chlorum TaxID=2698 RepID=A0ABR7SXN6_HELCL|nr:C40 family peptidase [Heliobacterium chlorum]
MEDKYISCPLADLWNRPDEPRQRVTQGWLGSPVEVLESQDGWQKVRLPEQGDYEGWIKADDLETKRGPSVEGPQVIVALPKAVFENGWLPLGAVFPMVDSWEEGGALLLPSGDIAWLPFGDMWEWPHKRSSENDRPMGEEVLQTAAQFLGTPYLWGGMSCLGIDCSGLVFMAYRLQGIELPRDAHEQWEVLEPVEKEKYLKPGDLIFFSTDGTIADHVGIVGDGGQGQFIHASSSLGGVQWSNWNEPRWKDSLFSFRRVQVST